MFKSNKSSKYKVVNWREYNQALKNRGSLTIWFAEDFDQHWFADQLHKQGRPLTYSDYSITLILSLRHLLKLPLRQVTGFVESLFSLLNKPLPVPDFSRLSRRSSKSLSKLNLASSTDATHIVVDSTGLKVFGEKEWLETKHGKQYQRKVWKKIHIGTDDKGFIVAQTMTDHKKDDRTVVPGLLDQINTQNIADMLGDSGYDSHALYHLVESKSMRPLIPPPKSAVVMSQDNPSFRDETVSYIKKKGYWAWYYKNDFGRRNRVENIFYRLKTIFSRKLSSRSLKNQKAESHLLCYLLNQMTMLGMPKTIKIA